MKQISKQWSTNAEEKGFYTGKLKAQLSDPKRDFIKNLSHLFFFTSGYHSNKITNVLFLFLTLIYSKYCYKKVSS